MPDPSSSAATSAPLRAALNNTDRLLLPREVADMFGVASKTVSRWAKDGRLASITTPAGHRRFRQSDVRRLLDGEG